MEINLDKDLRGGVTSVLLMSADEAIGAVFSSEGVALSLPSVSTVDVVPEEDSAQWTEVVERREGATRVEHRLEMAIPWAHQAVRLITDSPRGVVAVVTLLDGRKILAGYSAKFAAEQPLRIGSMTRISGRTREDDARWKIVLIGVDDAPAPNCTIIN